MARQRFRYQGTVSTIRWHRRQVVFRWCLSLALILIVSLVSVAAFAENNWIRMIQERLKADVADVRSSHETLCYSRLDRRQIPAINLYDYRFVDLFPDINDVQLVAAQGWGVKAPVSGLNLENDRRFVEIASNDLYVVDTMWHSRPYVIPAMAVLLQYIGERFATILAQQGRDRHSYRPIVTSALRTEDDVRRLLRNNSNASENSCHCYGTTVDITYNRFLRDDGVEIQEYWLRDILALVMYELRYEGLCYVRYEVRQPCFHFTVRDVEYKGPLPSFQQDITLSHVSAPIKHASPSSVKERPNNNDQKQTQQEEKRIFIEF